MIEFYDIGFLLYPGLFCFLIFILLAISQGRASEFWKGMIILILFMFVLYVLLSGLRTFDILPCELMKKINLGGCI